MSSKTFRLCELDEHVANTPPPDPQIINQLNLGSQSMERIILVIIEVVVITLYHYIHCDLYLLPDRTTLDHCATVVCTRGWTSFCQFLTIFPPLATINYLPYQDDERLVD